MFGSERSEQESAWFQKIGARECFVPKDRDTSRDRMTQFTYVTGLLSGKPNHTLALYTLPVANLWGKPSHLVILYKLSKPPLRNMSIGKETQAMKLNTSVG